jgi:hypothetical protein
LTTLPAQAFFALPHHSSIVKVRRLKPEKLSNGNLTILAADRLHVKLFSDIHSAYAAVSSTAVQRTMWGAKDTISTAKAIVNNGDLSSGSAEQC